MGTPIPITFTSGYSGHILDIHMTAGAGGYTVLARWKLDGSVNELTFCRETSVAYDENYTRNSLAAAVVAKEGAEHQIEKFIADRERKDEVFNFEDGLLKVLKIQLDLW